MIQNTSTLLVKPPISSYRTGSTRFETSRCSPRLIVAALVATGLVTRVALADSASDLPSAPPQPDKAEQAASHFDRAVRFAQQHDFEQAAREFSRAYELSPHHSVLFNLARVYAEMGRPLEAIETFRKYLADGGEQIPSARRSEVRALIDRQLALVAQVRWVVQPSGAEVLVDGLPVAPDPNRPLLLAPGEHRIQVRAPHHVPEERSLLVRQGDQLVAEFNLRPQLETVKRLELSVSCLVPQVEAIVDGENVGRSPGGRHPWSLSVPETARTLVFQRRGYGRHEVALPPDESVDCALVPMRPAPEPASRLVLRLSEPAARVTVDGVKFDGQALPAGQHYVEVRHEGFAPWSRLVTLGAGSSLQIEVLLVPEHPPADSTPDERANTAITRRHLSYAVAAASLGLGVAAGVSYLTNNQRVDRYRERGRNNNLCGESSRELTSCDNQPLSERQQQTKTQLVELEGTIRRWDQIAVGLGVGSAAALGTAAWLYLSSEPRRADAGWLLTGAGVAWYRTF